ncbi:hypothetical protein Tco_1129456 [Tanacetum coccineum]
MHNLSVITMMILILKTSHHRPNDAMHNPSLLLMLLSKELCFISHGDQHASIDFLIPRPLILKMWQSAPTSDHQITKNTTCTRVLRIILTIIARTFRVVLFSTIYSNEWKSFQSESTSNNSAVDVPIMRSSKYGESNATALEDLTLRAGNPVKEILLN